MKYLVTNTTAQTETGPRRVFIVEAGKLLEPGASIPCNRLDAGTLKLGEAGVLKIEEGDFPKPELFPKEKSSKEPAKIEPIPPKKPKAAKAEEPAPAPKPEPAPKPAPAASDDKTKDEQSGKKGDGN